MVGLQYVIVVFSKLLILRIAISIAAYRTLYLTNRAFRLKDGANTAFKTGTALTNVFYAKIVYTKIMCMLFHEHH